MSNAARYDEILDIDDLAEVAAREYLRVSHDASGVLRSPEEQHADHERIADRKHWTLGAPYLDEGSASRYRTKRRVDFDRLIADLEADTFGAQVLIIWEASRGTREVWEMAKLLTLCERRGVWVYITIDRRLYNPRVTRDWADLMRAALDAETEVRKTSERVRRASKADADAGRFTGGRRPYGYEANGVEIRPDEAQVIRDAVRAVLGGQTVRAVAAELNARGVPTSTGKAWYPAYLARLLASPRIAGRRVHHGAVMPEPAAWKGIIDEVTHRRLVAVLASRAPVGRRGRTPWLLTGLLRCELCDNVLSSNTTTSGARKYVCRKGPGYKGCGRLGIKAEPVEDRLGELCELRLVDLDGRGQADDEAEAELAELNAIEAERIEVAESGLSVAARAAEHAALDRRQRAAEARLAAVVRQTAPLAFVVAEGYVGQPWGSLTPGEQRIVLDALVGHVTVGPASLRGSTRFESSRVDGPGRIVWKA